MGRRGARAPRPLPGDPSDPAGLAAWTLRFLEHLRVRQLTEQTVAAREACLRVFLAWAAARDLTRPQDITRPMLVRYQRHLFHYRRKNGKPLSASTQCNRVSAVRMFFRWLTRENVILSNPASELDLPKLPKALPRHVLTPREAEAVLAQPDLEDVLGLRDRALLEVLYSTGARRSELAGLQLFDLDWENGTVRIRQGKGRKDRVVPIGERALAWCERYLREVRPLLLVPPDPGALFLAQDGEPLTGHRLSTLTRRYVERAALGKSGSCHLFRHSMATSMLEAGADIRFVQEMLGHSELSSTQIYTRVSIRKLKEIHSATHPSARTSRDDPEDAPPDRAPSSP